MSMKLSALMVAAVVVSMSACGADTGALTEGEKNYIANCLSCHGTGAVGGVGPNITFSTTAGIADYTQAQLLALVRMGTTNTGRMTCATMTRFSATQLSDAKVQTIYTYLQGLKNDKVNKGDSCR